MDVSGETLTMMTARDLADTIVGEMAAADLVEVDVLEVADGAAVELFGATMAHSGPEQAQEGVRRRYIVTCKDNYWIESGEPGEDAHQQFSNAIRAADVVADMIRNSAHNKLLQLVRRGTLSASSCAAAGDQEDASALSRFSVYRRPAIVNQ